MSDASGGPTRFVLTDYAVRLWRRLQGLADGVPETLVTAMELPIDAHLAMQAALQEFVDKAISKTINVPGAISFDDFAPLYRLAYDSGLKGCAVFRPSAERGAVLARRRDGADESADRCAGTCE